MTDHLRNARICLRTLPAIKDDLESFASADNRSLSGYIETVLVKHLEDLQRAPPARPRLNRP
jgi:hypothetical protein